MPSSPKTPQRTATFYAWCVCGFLLVAIGMIYGQTLGHGFLNYDDNGFVFANPYVSPGLTGEGIWWAFTDGPYGEWYPLASLSHMLDCQLFGLNAWGHHLTNVLLHAATSIALFLVWWRMTGELWPSAFVAAVFAVHPQHVESVAWVAERRDVLSGLFFMLTLAAWLGYLRHGRTPGRYLLVAVLFALGLMAKPMIVTLPAVLLLLDFWPLARIGSTSDTPGWTQRIERPGIRHLVWEKLPLVAIAAGDCWMTLRTHNAGGARMAWPARIGNAAVSCVDYIARFFYPVELAAFYPAGPGGPPPWKVAGAVAIVAAVSMAAVIGRRRFPCGLVGWFWYLGMLSPVLGLVQVSSHVMADRYMYLPGIGLYIALAWGGARCAAGSLQGRRLIAGCAGLLIAALTAGAAWQASFWHDDETLWTHALAVTSDNGEAEFNLGCALVRQGRIDDAITHFRRAEQHPVDASPFINLGLLLARQGKLDEAMAEYRQALVIDSDSFLASTAHARLGAALMQQNRVQEARENFRRAVEINPGAVIARCGLARLLCLEGKIDEGRDELKRAIALEPQNAEANDLGTTFFMQGRIDESIPHFEAALAIDPKCLLAHINLASALASRGQIDEATNQCGRALEIDPDNQVARELLDKLLAERRQP